MELFDKNREIEALSKKSKAVQKMYGSEMRKVQSLTHSISEL